jgi:CheY-like chemotaxis protein
MATILVIDDQASLRLLCKASLEGAGYHVLTAEDGKPALQLLEHVQADVIVMDICMPEMGGFELIPRIRGRHLGSKIIAMSGEADYLDIAKYLGVDDTISKPFNLEDLLNAVSAQLNFSDSRQLTS